MGGYLSSSEKRRIEAERRRREERARIDSQPGVSPAPDNSILNIASSSGSDSSPCDSGSSGGDAGGGSCGGGE